MKNYVKEYNKLVPLMNKLSNDGLDIWEFHDSYQGYGFKVIFKKTFVEVSLHIDLTSQKVSYYLHHNEMTGNILMGKELKRDVVESLEDIEKFIREVK